MDRSDFLEALGTEGRALGDVLDGFSRVWLVNLISLGRDRSLRDEVVHVDRIYEVACYFTAVRAFHNTSTSVRFVPGDGAHGLRLPYGPARKDRFAFFRITNAAGTFDLCPGTAVLVPGSDPASPEHEHPDISLQRSAPAAPSTPFPAVAIWDAKYHGKGLSKADLHQMFAWMRLLEVPRPAVGDALELSGVAAPFDVSGILTNAPIEPGRRTQCMRGAFAVTRNHLVAGKAHIQVPTRTEIAAG